MYKIQLSGCAKMQSVGGSDAMVKLVLEWSLPVKIDSTRYSLPVFT